MNPLGQPKTHLQPLRIAEETYVIQDHQGEGVDPMVVHLNSLVIRGQQPAVVDTGVPGNRDRYLNDLFTLVDPDDVRWIVLTHDDIDHYGNVSALMTMCPNATLVTTWFTMQRLSGELDGTPPWRWRWLADDEPLDIGDRRIVATRPPLYDSPTTRALFDLRTGVYWAADCFASPVERPTYDIAEVPAGAWLHGFQQFQQWNSPWIDSLDVFAWHRTIDRFGRIGVRTIASCHGPAIHEPHLPMVIEALRSLPSLPPAEQPGQALLDQIIAAARHGVPLDPPTNLPINLNLPANLPINQQKAPS